MKQLLMRCVLAMTLLFLLIWAGRASAVEAGKTPVSKAPAGETTVIKSDERSLVFEYRPQFAAPREIEQDGQKYTLYDFSGAIAPDMRKNTGSPDLRFRNFPVALPGPNGSVVQVIAADYEDISTVVYAPVPSMRIRDNMLQTGTYALNSAAYGTAGFMPALIADLTPATASRSLLLAGVRIYPLQYNAASRTVRKYRRIVVEVTYGPRTTRPVQNQDEVPFGNVLLNHNMTSSWKVASSPGAVKSSVLATGQWYRMTVNDSGMFRLSAQYLSGAGINIASIDPRTIKIYGNGGAEVPENVFFARPDDLVENAVYVEGETDGKFDPGDFVLFYGRSSRGWTYDASSKTFRHYTSHYTDKNYYWLTFGGANGKRMAPQASLSNGGVYAPEKYTDAVAVEYEYENLVGSGKDWYGQRIDPNSSFTLRNALPGLVPNDVIVYRYALVASSSTTPRFTVKERESSTVLGSYTLGTTAQDLAATAGTWQASGSSSLSNNTSQLNIAYQTSSVGAKSWIDWVEINYPRMYWAVGNVLHFRAPDTNVVVEYRLQQFTETPWVFNISSYADVRLITGVTGSYMFQASETARQPSEYWAAPPSAWKTPAAIETAANQDLRGFSAGAEFIIVTSPEFREPVNRLAAHRQGQGMSTVVVDVTQIYNEFAGGQPDITGIRDYLRYAYNNWVQKPRYVLFFGQASYDYKGILGSRSSYVPTWQSIESRDDIYSYSTDDFFVKFGSGDGISLVPGRIPSRTVAEANVVVDKLIRYDASSVRDSWKLRIGYIGDDSWTPEREDGTLHSDDAESLAEKHTPDVFEKKKIYIAEYPTEYTAQGRRKPGAFQAIINNVNQGVLLLNFAGHGNPEQLAHENIFNVQSSIPQLINTDRLAVFFMSTCNFSQFDDPVRTSGGELLLNKADGGAIGVMSATRKVYASENRELATGTYDFMFQYNSYGQVVVRRPAEALFLYKSGPRGNGVNDQKFFFMGDPTMPLQFPSGYASIDSINQQPLDTLNGVPVTTPVLVRALSRVTVSGSIRRQDNTLDNTFNGKLTLLVNDPTHKKFILNFWDSVPPWPYMETGGTIFRGENSVANGLFRASFVVPRDVSFADSTARGRMLAYFSNSSIDGAGITDKFRVGAPDSVQTSDQLGPKITLYLDGRSFRPGDMVSEKPTLIVDLEDSSGINTASSGIGHRIEAWINNSTQSTDVTDAYSSKLDNYAEGSVEYPLVNLPQGKNTLRVRAWDSFNNSTTAETYFDVATSDQLTLTDVMNYPNPFASSTEFTFRQNQSGLLNVTVKVYTVAGRVIQTLTTTSAGESFVRVPWDGRDRDGDILANGVYFYKILVSTADGQFSSEALGKLSIVK